MGGTQWARNVGVTFAAPTPSKTWWASWYVRLDPDWPAGGNGVNYKNWVVQTATGAYGGDCASCTYSSLAYLLERDWILGIPTQQVVYNGNTYYPRSNYPTSGYPYQFDIHRNNGGRHANEARGWVKMEALIAKNEVGEYGERAYSDWSSVGNGWAWYKGNVPNWEFSHGDFDPRRSPLVAIGEKH